jgi:hypothetical protein
MFNLRNPIELRGLHSGVPLYHFSAGIKSILKAYLIKQLCCSLLKVFICILFVICLL